MWVKLYFKGGNGSEHIDFKIKLNASINSHSYILNLFNSDSEMPSELQQMEAPWGQVICSLKLKSKRPKHSNKCSLISNQYFITQWYWILLVNS